MAFSFLFMENDGTIPNSMPEGDQPVFLFYAP